MMKQCAIVFIVFAVAAGVFAVPDRAGASEFAKEIESILSAKASVAVGTLTVGDLEALAGQVSVALQKSAYVRRAGMASFMVPGMGQFLVGNPVGGSLFLAGDVVVAAATIVGGYFLLPARLQFGAGNGTVAAGLDYLNTPMAQIHEAWKSGKAMEYLTSAGVLLAGVLANRLLGFWASAEAVETARRNVAEGKVTFQPVLFPLAGSGPLGMGMGMRMRY